MIFHTTHVGSVPRSRDVVDIIFARENNQPFQQADIRQTDMVNDGETSKVSCATDAKERYTGFSGDGPMVMQNDFYTAWDEHLTLSRHMLFQDLIHDECVKIATASI